MKSIDKAISQVEILIKVLKKNSSSQVRNLDEKATVKAIAFSWFQNERTKINLTDTQLEESDGYFKYLLEASEKDTIRKNYISKLKALRETLIKLRSDNIVSMSNLSPNLTDEPPDFSSLVKDDKMKLILTNRWDECIKCIQANAPLSALVMTGGLLEAILLAIINSNTDKSKIFKAKFAPSDKKTLKVYPLQEWTLRNYIDVAHELNWISQSTKDVGEVLRDYRNYIHPYKEFSHGIKLTKDDVELFWQISKSIINQLLLVK